MREKGKQFLFLIRHQPSWWRYGDVYLIHIYMIYIVSYLSDEDTSTFLWFYILLNKNLSSRYTRNTTQRPHVYIYHIFLVLLQFEPYWKTHFNIVCNNKFEIFVTVHLISYGTEKKLEDIRSRNSKDRQCNGQQKKDKWTKGKTIVDKASYRKLKILQHEPHYNGGELRCYRSVNSSCSSSGAHHLC